MKKSTYYCDYCGGLIDPDLEEICILHPGHIGYKDSLIHDDEEKTQHYHDTCMNYLLCLQAKSDPNKKEQPKTNPKTEEKSGHEVSDPDQKQKNRTYNNYKDKYTGPVKKGQKDLPALNAFLKAGKSQAWCAEEFGVAQSTIHRWAIEIATKKAAGTWEDYCKERSTS